MGQMQGQAPRKGWIGRALDFWRSTAFPESFPRLTRLTWIFGLLLPALGLLIAVGFLDSFDPFRVFVYTYGAFVLAALTIWLLLGGSAGGWTGICEGVFLGGCLFATVIGLVLLPFTIFAAAFSFLEGLLLVLVVFGLAPFTWALALAAQARQARAGMEGPGSSLRSLLRLAAVVGPPLLAAILQVHAYRIESRLREAIVSARGPDLDAALKSLFRWGAVVDVDLLFAEYDRRLTSDPEGAERIELAYRRGTGSSLADSPPLPGPIELEIEMLTDRWPARGPARAH